MRNRELLTGTAYIGDLNPSNERLISTGNFSPGNTEGNRE